MNQRMCEPRHPCDVRAFVEANAAVARADNTAVATSPSGVTALEGAAAENLESLSAMRRVVRMARQIEPDPNEAGRWYQRTGIAELDGLTAARLVSLGRADEVVEFLQAVRDGERG